MGAGALDGDGDLDLYGFDLDGDGNADFAVSVHAAAEAGGSEIFAVYGDGAGSFGAPVSVGTIGAPANGIDVQACETLVSLAGDGPTFADDPSPSRTSASAATCASASRPAAPRGQAGRQRADAPCLGVRLGLCCSFVDEPIRFRRTTARYLGPQAPAARRAVLGQIALDNADALLSAITWCAGHGVGAFRVNSQLFPLATHPDCGYDLDDLPTWPELRGRLRAARHLARAHDIRLSLHPDQFVVPGSESADVAARSLAELEHQAHIAQLIGAEQLTLHGGSPRPSKAEALDRLERALDSLSPRARARIALENDDRSFTVEDLLPLCTRAHIPQVYDVHHHRCLPDALSVDEATDATAATWRGREPWAHISSPQGGWNAPNPRAHADYIAPRDLPASWPGRRLTVDVEAKAKEKAVLRLQRYLARQYPAQASPASP